MPKFLQSAWSGIKETSYIFFIVLWCLITVGAIWFLMRAFLKGDSDSFWQAMSAVATTAAVFVALHSATVTERRADAATKQRARLAEARLQPLLEKYRNELRELTYVSSEECTYDDPPYMRIKKQCALIAQLRLDSNDITALTARGDQTAVILLNIISAIDILIHDIHAAKDLFTQYIDFTVEQTDYIKRWNRTADAELNRLIPIVKEISACCIKAD